MNNEIMKEKAREQLISNLQYEGFLHKLYEQQYGDCGIIKWYQLLKTQCVDDMSLNELLKSEKYIRTKVVKPFVADDEVERIQLIMDISYGGWLYKLYVENNRELLLQEWFEMLGLYTYEFSNIGFSYYMDEEIKKFRTTIIHIILDKYMRQRYVKSNNIVMSQMVGDKLIMTVYSNDDEVEICSTYVGKINGDEIKVAESCFELVGE